MHTKTLSIITVNKNNAAGLKKTIQSVVCQTNSDFEYIIIDGASEDESVEIIKKYIGKINYWISEPDTGIYNAMNKGIRQAHGNYCLFLNSGDSLVSSETLDNIFKEINGKQADIFYSDRINSDGNIAQYPGSLTIGDLLGRKINHQNSLIRRALFFEHSFYNENFKICSDYEFFLHESYKYNSTFRHIKTKISIYEAGGLSAQNKDTHRAEDFVILKNVFQESANNIIEIFHLLEKKHSQEIDIGIFEPELSNMKKAIKKINPRSPVNITKRILRTILPAKTWVKLKKAYYRT